MTRLSVRRALKVTAIVLGTVLAGAAAVVVYFAVRSPGTVEPITDEKGKPVPNSISEKTWVSINGTEQGMFIRGRDARKPVLLFLHGGPGMPEYFMFDKYETGLEDHFVVCYWEQRGAGLSYHPGEAAQDITVEQLVRDTASVAQYLRERFGRQKVYLMGHSWGSFIGIQSAASNPELYEAYIGVSQISDQARSEMLAYDYLLDQYSRIGNSGRVAELQQFDVHSSEAALDSFSTSALRDTAMHELGVGSTRTMNSVITGIFLPVMECAAYTLGEKVNIWRAKSFLNSQTDLHRQMMETDLSETARHFTIPVYFMAGLHDYTVNYDLQRQYFDAVDAPRRGFYSFENSAHSPLFEEPQRFLDAIEQIVE